MNRYQTIAPIRENETRKKLTVHNKQNPSHPRRWTNA